MLHKPAGVVTANKDKKLPTIMDLLSPDIQSDKLYSVGRLDRDTTGLLLLTDNGPLGFQLLHPQYHVDKTYQVQVNGLLTPDHIQAFQKGIDFLDGTVCKPASLRNSICKSFPQSSLYHHFRRKISSSQENVPLGWCQGDLPQTVPILALGAWIRIFKKETTVP